MIDGAVGPVLSASRFDSLASVVNGARLNEEVVDTLDFDGDGVPDRLVASSGRGGIIAGLYLARADSVVRVASRQGDGRVYLGQEFAACHLPSDAAEVHTYSAIGVHGDLSATTLRLEAGTLRVVSREGFAALVEGREPIPEPERGRRVARARVLKARTLGPPPGCAFRCSYLDCCAAGECPEQEEAFPGESAS